MNPNANIKKIEFKRNSNSRLKNSSEFKRSKGRPRKFSESKIVVDMDPLGSNNPKVLVLKTLNKYPASLVQEVIKIYSRLVPTYEQVTGVKNTKTETIEVKRGRGRPKKNLSTLAQTPIKATLDKDILDTIKKFAPTISLDNLKNYSSLVASNLDKESIKKGSKTIMVGLFILLATYQAYVIGKQKTTEYGHSEAFDNLKNGAKSNGLTLESIGEGTELEDNFKGFEKTIIQSMLDQNTGN
jgi:hypothetical protein